MATNGTLTRGTPVFSAGKFGNALSGAVYNAAGVLDSSATFTLEGWVKGTVGMTGNRVAFGRNNVVWVGCDTTGNAYASYGGSGTTVNVGSSFSLRDDTWHHLAVVVSAGVPSLYVDGSRKSVGASAGTVAASAVAALGIGGFPDTATTFDWPGQVDEVAVSSIAQYTGTSFTLQTAPHANDRIGQTNVYHLEADATDSDVSDAPPSVSFAPNDAAFTYSPYNWDVTAARALTNCGGAYVRTLVTGAPSSIVLKFDVSSIAAAGKRTTIGYRINNQAWVDVEPAAEINVAIPAAMAAWPKHNLEVVMKTSSATGVDRWVAPYVTAVKFTGLTLSTGSSIAAPTKRKLYGLCYGDSITEGISTLSGTGDETTRSDSRQGWAYQLRDILGAEIGVVGYGGTGIVKTAAGVPGLRDSWSFLADALPRTFTQAPDFILLNEGTNDQRNAITSVDFTLNLKNTLNSIAGAVPTTTKIIVMVPFGGHYGPTVFAEAIAATTNPKRYSLIDTTGWWSTADAPDALHPYGYINTAKLAPMTGEAVRAILNAGGQWLNVGGVAKRVSPKRN